MGKQSSSFCWNINDEVLKYFTWWTSLLTDLDALVVLLASISWRTLLTSPTFIAIGTATPDLKVSFQVAFSWVASLNLSTWTNLASYANGWVAVISCLVIWCFFFVTGILANKSKCLSLASNTVMSNVCNKAKSYLLYQDKFIAFPANISLGWKSLPRQALWVFFLRNSDK